ncbi:MAG: Arc family DNA-binding protein [Phormidesmis sp. CAN_BIN36]|nr:Arc family DNA-binding protein [Phormidesmis sp. CAN_BIN36]
MGDRRFRRAIVDIKREVRSSSFHPILSHNANNGSHCAFMKTTETISTQVTLPIELYQAIAQRAQAHGKSVDSEIVALLLSLLEDATELAQEFADWEAASDDDWLHLEAVLTSQEN